MYSPGKFIQIWLQFLRIVNLFFGHLGIVNVKHVSEFNMLDTHYNDTLVGS